MVAPSNKGDYNMTDSDRITALEAEVSELRSLASYLIEALLDVDSDLRAADPAYAVLAEA
jgi:hypothetical protein